MTVEGTGCGNGPHDRSWSPFLELPVSELLAPFCSLVVVGTLKVIALLQRREEKWRAA
jgi:hypothetical protein